MDVNALATLHCFSSTLQELFSEPSKLAIAKSNQTFMYASEVH